MQYRKCSSQWPAVLSATFLVILLVGTVAAQPAKTTKTQRPTKYPTQFDKIIDPNDKTPEQKEKQEASSQPPVQAPDPNEALIKAVDALTQQVKSLVDEVRAGNSRAQINTEVMRMSRFDLRIDRYEAEMKTVRERLAVLETDYTLLVNSLTPEALEQQVSRMPYASKTEAIARVKETNENRLRVVSTERDLVKRREAELTGILSALREVSTDTEKRLLALEEQLRKSQPEPQGTKPDTP